MGKSQAQKIYDTLMSQRFVDWYEEQFTDHVTGEPTARSYFEIVHDIKRIFKLEDDVADE